MARQSYFHRGRVFTLPEPLPTECFPIGTNENESEEKFIEISEQRASELEAKSKPLHEQEERRSKYAEQADRYLLAYQGYLLEGDTEKAQEQKKLYLQTKAAIRAQYE